jgi:hypothetical protein
MWIGLVDSKVERDTKKAIETVRRSVEAGNQGSI